MTLPALHDAMVTVYEDAGDEISEAPFAQQSELERMHHLRNVMFGHSPQIRKQICGRPAQ